METTDLRVALALAQEACLRAAKEAAWAKETLTESEEENERVETAQSQIEAAMLHLRSAQGEVTKENDV